MELVELFFIIIFYFSFIISFC